MIKTLNRIFGTLTLLIALVNIFRGNDPGFGIFILLLALLYIPPTEKLYKKYGLTDDEIAFIDSMIRPMDLTQNDDTDE